MAFGAHLTGSLLDRRAFLKGLALVVGVGLPRAAAAQKSFWIGLVMSQGPLSESLARGTELGLAEANVLAGFFGKRIELLQATVPTPRAAFGAGLRLARDKQVLALIGGADDGSAEALRDAAQQSEALFFNVGATSDRLRGERCDRHTFNVLPSLAMQVGAVGYWLVEKRKLARWALVVTDSPVGQETEEDAVAFLRRRGERVLARERVTSGTTDWKPVLQRMRKVRPEVVLVGLDPTDLLGFIRQYRAAGLPFQLAGVAPDPSVLFAADPLELAGVWPLAWHHELKRYSARELNSKFRKRFHQPFDGPAWSAWAAVKLCGEAIVRGEATDAAGLLRFIESAPPFDAHKGQALTFREWDHQLRQPMYLAGPRTREQAAGRVGALEVITQVPRGNLDLICPPRDETQCQFET